MAFTDVALGRPLHRGSNIVGKTVTIARPYKGCTAAEASSGTVDASSRGFVTPCYNKVSAASILTQKVGPPFVVHVKSRQLSWTSLLF